MLYPLDDSTLTLANAGGKGLSLGRLARLGYPVPPGFVISTATPTTSSRK